MTARHVSVAAIAVIVAAGFVSVFALFGAVEGGWSIDSGGVEVVTTTTTKSGTAVPDSTTVPDPEIATGRGDLGALEAGSHDATQPAQIVHAVDDSAEASTTTTVYVPPVVESAPATVVVTRTGQTCDLHIDDNPEPYTGPCGSWSDHECPPDHAPGQAVMGVIRSTYSDDHEVEWIC